MNTRILASELTKATSGYFDFQRREVLVRGQNEPLLISDCAIRGAAVLMASSSRWVQSALPFGCPI